MTDAWYLTNARLVLPEQILKNSSLLIADGTIQAIEPAGGGNARTVDLAGQTLLPGLIDLHCDAIEKEAEPRARVLFPLDFAIAQVDRRNAAAGITTPFHAMSFANNESGVRCNQTAAALARALRAYAPRALVDNRVHCRYEVTDPVAAEVLHALIEEGMVDLLSVMDHSPGQGQFKTIEAYIDYMMGNHAMARDDAEAAARAKTAAGDGAAARVSALLAKAKEFGIRSASHDDDSPARVASMHALGVTMSEFPINMETASAARAVGLATILGAPNVLRGKSQSGSMRAIDAIRAGLVSCLCSDYQPSALIAAAFVAAEKGDMTLPAAVALVSANPAQAGGLTDRGSLVVGLRADLVAVSLSERWPTVTRTWSGGHPVFVASYRSRQAA